MIISGNDLDAQLNLQKDCMVTFMNGTDVFGTQVVLTGGKASKPTLRPTQNGHWDADFSLPVTTDTLIYWVEE
jgi:hypothetical protein